MYFWKGIYGSRRLVVKTGETVFILKLYLITILSYNINYYVRNVFKKENLLGIWST